MGCVITQNPRGEAAMLNDQFMGQVAVTEWIAPRDDPAGDDLDLSAMARAALNYLRGNPDPARRYECKFSLGPLGIPWHVPLIQSNEYGYDPVTLGDTDCRMNLQYEHMRQMAGEDEPDPVELGVHQRALSYLREDDLCWINPAAYVGQPVDGEWVGTWTTAKVMMSIVEGYAQTGDEGALAQARKMLHALRGLAEWKDGCAFYRGIAPYRDGEWLMDGWCESHGRNYPFIVEPCVRYWECTGEQEALDLACAFADGFLAGVQPDQQNHRIDPETGAFEAHVHLHTHAIWGVAHLGAVLGEQRYLDWAQRAYEFVRGKGTDFGWYPEFIPQPEWRTEICVVGDMVGIGVWLARGGEPHYWDHIERTVRNELRRSQFFLTPEFVELFREVHRGKPDDQVEQVLRELKSIEGGFVAQATFDDWVSYPGNLGAPGLNANGIHMMGCCPPEGMHGLWEAWEGAVEKRPGGVFVNMALTRDHEAAGVRSYACTEGRLDVTARQADDYLVRVPAWADKAGVGLSVNGQEQTPVWGGPREAYVLCPSAQPGDAITVTWLTPRFTQSFAPTSVPGRDAVISVEWVGNTVVGVTPAGEYLPMFHEPARRAGEVT